MDIIGHKSVNTTLFYFAQGNLIKLAEKYNFPYRVYQNSTALCANTNYGTLEKWIEIEKTPQAIKFNIYGNTDQLNLWFSETRKDLTPEKLKDFVEDLNENVLKSINEYCELSTLIDPEDWQEIANVQDASLDKRYTKNFLDDEEKINDFFRLSKDEFLEFYNYISKEEYYHTVNIINANSDNLYIKLSLNGKFLTAYDLKNTFPGELQDTLRLESYENKCDKNDIKISLITLEEYENLQIRYKKEDEMII